MADANNQDETIDIDDDISDIEEDVNFEGGDLDETLFQRLKSNDSKVTYLHIGLNPDNDGKCFFNSVNWKEDGGCIANNTNLRELVIEYRGPYLGRKYYLGDQGHNRHILPTRQQLQDFFSCIYRNSSIKVLSFRSMIIVDEFGGSLIEGLQGHPGLTSLYISFSSLSNSNGLGNTLMKVLKHPKCRLKCLDLSDCILEDKGISIICDSLMHNSTLKRLFLNNTQIGLKQITSVGWGALSTFIRHPNCQLVELGLYSFGINDDGVGILGSAVSGSSLKTLHLSSYNSISSSLRQIINDEGANLGDSLHGSSLKVLNLSYNEYISSAGWQRLFNQLSQSQTQIESIGANDNNIGDTALAALASISTLKSLDLHRNQSITPTGWQSFFNSLQTRGTQLVELDITGNKVGDVGVAALGSLLSSMSTLKTLNVNDMANTEDDPTSQGWQALFTTLLQLQDSNLDLIELNLGNNSIDDEGLQLLVRLVSSMSSLKHLNLYDNRGVTPTGWQALTGYLRSPNFALKELRLNDNRLNDDTVIALTSALEHNRTLEQLLLGECYDEDFNNLITERGWEAISNLVCNKTSIMDTYNSNHTLHDVSYNIPNDTLVSYLALNENEDKVEVARQKILQTLFYIGDTSKIQELLDMELEVMPNTIAWIGKTPHAIWKGTNVSGLSLMYNLMRKLPDLFDSGANKKPAATKRKRDI